MKWGKTIAATVTALGVCVPTVGVAVAEDQSNSDDQQAGKCPAVHVLLAPGTSETMQWGDPNADNHGYLSSLITPVLNQVNPPGVKDKGAGFSQVISNKDSTTATETPSDGETPVVSRTTITYPSSAGGVWAGMGLTPNKPRNFGDPTSYDDSVKQGVAKTLMVAKAVADRCPDTAINLIGYSQGAEVMSAAAREIGAGKTDVPADHIGGVALFADPTREAGTPTLASGGDAMGQMPKAQGNAVSGVLNNLSQIKTPKASGLSQDETGVKDFGDLNERVISWCLPGDYVCGLPAESKVAKNLVQVLEKLHIDNPVEALRLLASSVDSAVKASDYSKSSVADLDYGPDGFKAAGLQDQTDPNKSVLADRVKMATAETTDSDSALPSASASTGASASESESEESSLATPTSSTTATDMESESVSESTSETSSSEATASTSESETSTATSEATSSSASATESGSILPSEVKRTNGGITTTDDSLVAPRLGAQGKKPGDPLASPENFVGAVVPLAARLGGMALGTGVTLARKTLTPENIAQIAAAGVTGGPQAAATVAGAKFAKTGMTLLNPSYVSGRSREVLQAVKDSGFTVPETMELAVDLSSWLSVDEHVAYGKRPMMADGRTAEQATQQWLMASAGDMTGDPNVGSGTTQSPLGSGGSLLGSVGDVLGAASDSGATGEQTFDNDQAFNALQSLIGGK